MAEKKSQRTYGEGDGDGVRERTPPFSGPIKITWIRLVPSTFNGTTVKRCYFGGRISTVTDPTVATVFGYFDVVSATQVQNVKDLAAAWADVSNINYTEETGSPDDVSYQIRDAFLDSNGQNPSASTKTNTHKLIFSIP